MSGQDDGDIDITHGGALSVDTEELRSVAIRLRAIESTIGEASEVVYLAHRWITQTAGLSAAVDTVALWAVGDRLSALHARIGDASTGTHLMSEVYELVELRAEHDMLLLAGASPTDAAAEAVQMKIEDLEASDERLSAMADALVLGWEGRRDEGLDEQFGLASMATGVPFGAITSVIAALGGSRLLSKLPPGATLRGTADPVHVRPVKTSQPPAPPASLADALRRFPETDGAQVKVETYIFEDGSRRYVAYIAGTQTALYGAGDPWDMKSNLELYTGRTSASYQATVDALHQAGAETGDVVDVYAHSQGGMVSAYLAMGDAFDVNVQVTAGSPVEPSVDDDQLIIQLRHSDDLVNALSGGGSPEGTGSPDSLIVQREGHPEPSWEDIVLKTHQLETYVETAEMADGSGDVRLEAYLDNQRDLAGAVAIESTEFIAERTGRAP